MQFLDLLGSVLAAFRARAWSWLAGLAVAAIGAALVYGFIVDPALAPLAAADSADPPYRTELDPRAAMAGAQARAAASGKMLMVTYGANWCPDCLRLYENLHAPETRAYAEEHFEMINIDVGDSRKNAAVQRDLGIAVNVIPLAVFYSPAGEPVGDTLGGELKPSRHYTSREIRDFLREVVDYRRIVSPDQRQ